MRIVPGQVVNTKCVRVAEFTVQPKKFDNDSVVLTQTRPGIPRHFCVGFLGEHDVGRVIV